MTRPKIVTPKKLIEVAVPLDEINKACAREKTIRHGHPSTLHLWWARRPLAAARAVLFAQLVNDPSWKYSADELKKPATKGVITKRRNELFKLVTELVQWENTTNERVLERARAEIRASWRETCDANKDHPEAPTLFNPTTPPAFHDPFAGGGAIPLEAQRLGLEAHASDLNPVAVLINKAMIEVPADLTGRAPFGPVPASAGQSEVASAEAWPRTTGLSEDILRYGTLLRDEAARLLAGVHTKLRITPAHVASRPDLAHYLGRELTPMTWLWARTVASPNPAARGEHVPLIASFVVSEKPGNEAWVVPEVEAGKYSLLLKVGELKAAERTKLKNGTRAGKAQDFVCVLTNTTISREYVRTEGKAKRLGERLLAVVAEGDRERVFLDASWFASEVLNGAQRAQVAEARRTFLSGRLPSRAMITGGVCSAYGLDTWGELFTERQALSLLVICDGLRGIHERVLSDCVRAGADPHFAGAYAKAITTYLSLAIGKFADNASSLCTWHSGASHLKIRATFSRQALTMSWDFAEGNPWSSSTGNFLRQVELVREVVAELPSSGKRGSASQADAQTIDISNAICSTDPPYYDNIAYAELADYFYVWLRHACSWLYPELMATLLTPKAEELVVAPSRHGGKEAAEAFFLDGMTRVMRGLASRAHPAIPISIYYAFKQSETEAEGTGSIGWEAFLEAVLRAGLAVVGTWPMRTELGNRMIGQGTNALASSIVLVCRSRAIESVSVARKDFARELDRALPVAIAEMTADPIAAIAPVDLAQACIGPGMAIFSKYKSVLEADGEAMTVHNALVHINKAIDDYFAHAEGHLDADTRFCVGWFEQFGFETGAYGEADVLARAKGTSVDGVKEAGVIEAGKGKVRLLSIRELPATWDPTKDPRVPVWEACHQMCRALGDSEGTAGALLARMPEKQESIRLLAYRLYTLCERKGRAEQARAYNELVASWPAIVDASHAVGHVGTQLGLV